MYMELESHVTQRTCWHCLNPRGRQSSCNYWSPHHLLWARTRVSRILKFILAEVTLPQTHWHRQVVSETPLTRARACLSFMCLRSVRVPRWPSPPLLRLQLVDSAWSWKVRACCCRPGRGARGKRRGFGTAARPLDWTRVMRTVKRGECQVFDVPGFFLKGKCRIFSNFVLSEIAPDAKVTRVARVDDTNNVGEIISDTCGYKALTQLLRPSSQTLTYLVIMCVWVCVFVCVSVRVRL